MQNSSSFGLWKRLLLAAIGVNFLAFVSPQKDDLVELKGFLHGRNQARFTSDDNNKAFILNPGTRGIVKKVQHFPATNNYGICLQVMNAKEMPSNQECTWVYYNVKNPNMNLYSVAQVGAAREAILSAWAKDSVQQRNQVGVQKLNAGTTPSAGLAAQTVRQVSGIIETAVTTMVTGGSALAPMLTGGSPVADSAQQKIQVDSEAALRTALSNMSEFNKRSQEVMTPTTSAVECAECAARIQSYATCNAQNDYMENELSRLLSGSDISSAINGSQREIIRKACVQRSLDTYPNMRNAFRNCEPGDQTARKVVAKACVSKNYVDVTANSFNAVAECLGDYVSGSADTKREAALAVFSLATLESGLHSNAMSPTGAGGFGQFTNVAIQDVNSRLKNIRAHLGKSSNPVCSQVLMKVLDEPMSASSSKTCDRVALSKNNPLKNMIYTFAYQGSQRKYLEETALKSRIFSGVLSPNLPASERERLASMVTVWSHNTGPGGMKVPLTAMMTEYLQAGKSVKTAADVDQFLRDLQLALVKYPHSANRARARVTETSTFLSKIQERVARIAKEPRQCLAD